MLNPMLIFNMIERLIILMLILNAAPGTIILLLTADAAYAGDGIVMVIAVLVMVIADILEYRAAIRNPPPEST